MSHLLELRHLRTLIALAESGNLSVAAQRVHLTQSALSHQLKLLEDHYDARLFERKTNPLRLSSAGQRLLALAHVILEQVDDAERDIAKLTRGESGALRVAVECHTCFDWLMPAMDTLRENWPEVELDLVSGFHTDPVALLEENRAELVIISEPRKRKGIVYHPLFRFEIVALLANNHPLATKSRLDAKDFGTDTLISYPVPDEMIDLIRQVLKPARVQPRRRSAELTVAILQLVASRRGIAALPGWSVESYIRRGYITAKHIGKKGLWGNLYAATTRTQGELPYMQDFLETIKANSFGNLPDILPIT